MINFNDDVKAIVKKHNPNWQQIPNRIFLIRGMDLEKQTHYSI